MASESDLEAGLDDLYAADPGDFIAERGKLAKGLAKEGRKDEAAQVRKLRKPTRAAALLNELSRESPKEIEALLTAGEKLRDAGTVSDQKSLRGAVAEERRAVEALLDAARAKEGASAATLERVGETLRAAAGDPELAELVRSGRLDSERETSTIGFELALMTPAPGKGKAKESKKAKDAARKQERAKLKRLEKDLATAEHLQSEAEERVELAEEQLKRARAAARRAAGESKAARAELAKEQKAGKKA
jgi:hypothetical protein